MERFQTNKYLTKKEKHELSLLLNMEEHKIAMWYTEMRRSKPSKGTSTQGELSSVRHFMTTLNNTCENYGSSIFKMAAYM